MSEPQGIAWDSIDWRTCYPATVRDVLHRAGVPFQVARALMGRLQDGHRSAWDLQQTLKRVEWLTSQLPETKHWPPSTRDPHARAPADSDG
jgi:hypothetical protein